VRYSTSAKLVQATCLIFASATITLCGSLGFAFAGTVARVLFHSAIGTLLGGILGEVVGVVGAGAGWLAFLRSEAPHAIDVPQLRLAHDHASATAPHNAAKEEWDVNEPANSPERAHL